jgi:hypothetical protein
MTGFKSIINKDNQLCIPKFRAMRLSDGKWVEGSLIMSSKYLPFAYILTDEAFGGMYVDETENNNNCSCKLVRVLAKSVEQII